MRRQASIHHMCDENRSALELVETKPEAVALYLKTIDWALERGFPGMRVLREYFSDCEDLGVFIDKSFSGERLTALPVYVFHHCTGMVRVGLNVADKIIPMLYFADGCDMTIRPSDSLRLGTRVPLYVFGENRVSGKSDDNAIFKCYNFSVE